MRMLMIFTAGAALLSAPAFAQAPMGGQSPYTYPSSPNPPAAAPAPQQDASMQPAPGEAPPPPPPPPPGNEPGVTAPPPSQPEAQPGVTSERTPSGSRLYTTQSGDIQVISNAPVPDTPANRAKFRPLSRLGRETRPKGN